ncbi:MAG TPA: ParB N-terminal domain-containing protein [Planctomycetota bacterium]|nr:ParB N-terminal domain-containing protein [Planctomycetota bacterium]
MAAAKKKSTRKKAEPSTRGLLATDVAATKPTAEVQRLADQVTSDGGTVLAHYRDPLGGHAQLLVALPLAKVAPTPFQRDLSATHVKRLTERIGELDRFLDPIIAVRRDDGSYWTPNGNHRLHAMKALGAQSITALLVPEERIAYRILALNTEKAHNLREKAVEVIRMARDLAGFDTGKESAHANVFEEPALLTLGVCYEQNGRFAGGVYRPVLKVIDGFLEVPLAKAIVERERRAALLVGLDEQVAAAVARLKAKGFDSPYLKNFVMARINPLRWQKDKAAEFDATLQQMTAAAKKFDAAKVDAASLAATGGAPAEE